MHIVSDRTAERATAARTPRLFRLAFTALGSACEVVVGATDRHTAAHLAGRARAEVLRIERQFAPDDPDSALGRLNATAGRGDTLCDDETLGLLDQADTLHRRSGGLFDISCGALNQAWNFRVADLPTPAELAALLPRVGWHQVQRDGRRVRLPEPGMALDLGALLKEHAADAAARLLREAGTRHGYVQLGHDVHAVGPQPDGSPWAFSLRDPRAPRRVVATVPLLRGGLATSGEHQRFIDVGGRRYGPLFDPRSGWPVSHWRQVSVQAASAAEAGACATLAVLLRDQALAFLGDTGHHHLAIDHRGHLHLKGLLPVDSRAARPPLTDLEA